MNVESRVILDMVKVSARNQVALPKKVLEALHVRPGERLLVRVTRGRIELVPEHEVEATIEAASWGELGLGTFQKHWDNEDDTVWDSA